MNPHWETPPHGDFASYVDRLMAQSALAAQRAQYALRAQAQETGDGQAQESPPPLDMLAPGRQHPSDNPLARGLLAAFGALREKLEHSLAIPPNKK